MAILALMFLLYVDLLSQAREDFRGVLVSLVLPQPNQEVDLGEVKLPLIMVTALAMRRLAVVAALEE
jgi:hypothetical protein